CRSTGLPDSSQSISNRSVVSMVVAPVREKRSKRRPKERLLTLVSFIGVQQVQVAEIGECRFGCAHSEPRGARTQLLSHGRGVARARVGQLLSGRIVLASFQNPQPVPLEPLQHTALAVDGGNACVLVLVDASLVHDDA